MRELHGNIIAFPEFIWNGEIEDYSETDHFSSMISKLYHHRDLIDSIILVIPSDCLEIREEILKLSITLMDGKLKILDSEQYVNENQNRLNIETSYHDQLQEILEYCWNEFECSPADFLLTDFAISTEMYPLLNNVCYEILDNTSELIISVELSKIMLYSEIRDLEDGIQEMVYNIISSSENINKPILLFPLNAMENPFEFKKSFKYAEEHNMMMVVVSDIPISEYLEPWELNELDTYQTPIVRIGLDNLYQETLWMMISLKEKDVLFNLSKKIDFNLLEQYINTNATMITEFDYKTISKNIC